MRLRGDRWVERREQAKERNERWATLSLNEKIASLKLRPGLCKKQFSKLMKGEAKG